MRIGVVRVVGFVAVLWWVFATICRGFYFLFFLYIFWWLGLRLWLVVVVVAVAMVRGDELGKLRPWRFLEQISERGRSFSVCTVGFFFFFGGWGLRLWLVVVAMAVAVAVVYR